jgi:MFS family permease
MPVEFRMHNNSAHSPIPSRRFGWVGELTRYHVFVFVVASLGWLFDTMDQRIFLISRQAAITELLGYTRDATGHIATYAGEPVSTQLQATAEGEIRWYSGLATTVFMLGWATGGLYFGIMGDKWGRARTMLITILIYSLFTGLSALSCYWWDFMIYRFITGMGVGGEFAAGVALVAEVMPASARPIALGALQALSAVGNIAGSLLNVAVGNWRYMFIVGVVPSLLVVAVRRRLKEPDRWQKAKQAGQSHDLYEQAAKELGDIRELLHDPVYRRHTIIGFLMALSGVIGLWGVAFWSFELVGEALRGSPQDDVRRIRGVGTALQDVGAFFGILTFTWLTSRLGRRPAFLLAFLCALVAAVGVFTYMRTESDVYWMLPVLGYFTLSVFGGYAIYFPELYPTRLRSTGTGFCYNAARFIAAIGPFSLGHLGLMYQGVEHGLLSSLGGIDSPLRYAAVTVALIYLLGAAVLPFAPETRGKPLPE